MYSQRKPENNEEKRTANNTAAAARQLDVNQTAHDFLCVTWISSFILLPFNAMGAVRAMQLPCSTIAKKHLNE